MLFCRDDFCRRNHPWESFFLQGDAREAGISLTCYSLRTACCSGIIRRNYLWKSFFLQRDAFRRRKSSLGELFSAGGCISQKEIIPGRAFFCRGMHFAEGNHLWESFFLQGDAFRRRKASLEEFFFCRGMHFAEGKHLWKSFSLQRDEFRRRKSSLGELFSAEGCSAPPNNNP